MFVTTFNGARGPLNSDGCDGACGARELVVTVIGDDAVEGTAKLTV